MFHYRGYRLSDPPVSIRHPSDAGDRYPSVWISYDIPEIKRISAGNTEGRVSIAAPAGGQSHPSA